MAGVTFMNVHFLWVLFTIPIMIALHFFLLRFTKRRAVMFANFDALRRVTGGIVLSKNITLLILRILIIFCLCLSAAGLTIWFKMPGSEFNYVIAIDASSSMLANDFAPNRLEVAKTQGKAFVDTLDADVNIGIVSFAGVPKTEIPLSSERSAVSAAFDGIGVSGAGGTDISSAIFTGVNILLTEKDRSMSIILVTDGQHTVGSPIEEGISYAVDNLVTVHTIGLGTEAGGSFEMTSLLSTLDVEGLSRIAETTGGNFYHASSESELINAFNDVVVLSEQNKPFQFRLGLLVAGLLLLIVEWVLANSRFRALP